MLDPLSAEFPDRGLLYPPRNADEPVLTRRHWIATGLIRYSVAQNRWVWYVIALSIVLVAAAASLPGLTAVLRVVPLGLSGWVLVLAGSLVPLVVGQTVLSMASRAKR